jgi:hypothetical protein
MNENFQLTPFTKSGSTKWADGITFVLSRPQVAEIDCYYRSTEKLVYNVTAVRGTIEVYFLAKGSSIYDVRTNGMGVEAKVDGCGLGEGFRVIWTSTLIFLQPR